VRLGNSRPTWPTLDVDPLVIALRASTGHPAH
jgi:hypothetical protein